LELEKDELERCGNSIGTSAGGLEEAGRWYHELLQISTEGNEVDINPTLADRLCYFPGSLAENINVTYGFKGISNVISTGCTASADAIGYAFEVIRRDQADIMLAGGTEAPINLFTIKAFDAINALSIHTENPQKASRPFDKERDGFVMGEGAAILVLEELEHAKSRGAHI
jgi:3-oxoacyl-(acyl-carrier-protein) synthase